MTPIEFIEALNKENRSFYEDDRGRGALKDLQVVFPVPWIYLAELVQNAIDVGATRLQFIPGEDGTLVFEHNGDEFSDRNVRALCTRGVSTKSTNTVGFMGVGFKSVFIAYERVAVSSGPWRFQLEVRYEGIFDVREWLGAVCPTWADGGAPPSPGYSCRFELSRRADQGRCETDLEELLREGEALLPLLAWNGVTHFRIGDLSWRLSKRPVGGDKRDRRIQVTALLNGTQSRSWILFIRTFKPSEAAVRRFLQHRQTQATSEEADRVLCDAGRSRQVIAFCEQAPDGSPIPVDRGQCFSLLPTGQSTCLGLHLQADWLLDISRREPMRLENNPWQQEILAQVPHLLKSFILWFTSAEIVGEGWSDGYSALPGPAHKTEIDKSVRGGDVAESLRSLLSDCAFIPCHGSQSEIVFAQPLETGLLPRALQQVLDSEDAPPARVFGPKIADPNTLGTRATSFLKDCGLIGDLSPESIQQQWHSDGLSNWYESAPDNRDAAYSNLIAGLGNLDAGAWKEIALPCLRAADGSWQARQHLKRYPPNWNVLGQDPGVAAALTPALGPPSELLDWRVDQSLRRNPSAQKYLADVDELSLEQVVGTWWSGLRADVEPETAQLVLQLTDFVRRTKLPRLLHRVLARVGERDQLLPLDRVVLAEPYVGDYRRVLFPDLPTVSGSYLTSGQDTDAEWRSFLEGQTKPPKGRPTLRWSRREATDREVAGLRVRPARRASFLTVNWQELQIDSKAHYIGDTRWPEGVRLPWPSPDREAAIGLQRWMLEAPGVFKTYRQQFLLFIPKGDSHVHSEPQAARSTWLCELDEQPWLFDRTGAGPYRPCDILTGVDLARPEAPVAELVDGFQALAEELGIRFGSAIPDAPAIDRLRISGTTATWPVLKALLAEAAAESEGDTSRTTLLQDVVRRMALFALPSGRRSLDGAARVSADRLVLGGRGSSLGDWVCSRDSFPEHGVERQVFEMVARIVQIAEVTSARQAASFLQWVWATEPEADSVRHLLPRAYQYVLESDSQARWVASNAKVFVTARRWVSVDDGNLYFNDLDIPDRELVAADAGIVFATPGHLSDDGTGRVAICRMLGLKLATSRFRVDVDHVPNDTGSSPTWVAAFPLIVDRFWTEASVGGDEGANSLPAPEMPSLVHVEKILRRVSKDGVDLKSFASRVAIQSDSVFVVGEPLDFASDLAQALLEHWGVSMRRDGYALGSRLTALIAGIDRHSIDATPSGPCVTDDEPLARSTASPHGADDFNSSDGWGAADEAASTPVRSSTAIERPTASRGSHTSRRGDAQHQGLLKKRDDLRTALGEVERQIAEGRTAEAIDVEGSEDVEPKRPFGNDFPYREAVIQYELAIGRFPLAAEPGQAGYDINSYSHAIGHPARALVRRIEVKGKGVEWRGDEVVELSDRQLRDALSRTVGGGELTSPEFDYWLYVVETVAGALQVLPIRNPSRRTSGFEFRSTRWRDAVEAEARINLAAELVG